MSDSTIEAREQAESLYIRSADGWNWARVFLQDGVNTGADGQPRHWSYVSVVSSFGNFGHCWGHMGQPLAAFLAGCERDPEYLMSKFFGDRYRVSDADEGMKRVRGDILDARRQGSVSREQARAWMDALRQVEDEWHYDAQSLAEALRDHDVLGDPFCDWEWGRHFHHNKVNPQAAGFRDCILPALLAEMKARAAKVPA